MNDNRRSREALGLRTFFDEQLHYLQKLAGGFGAHVHEKDRQEKQIMESFVDASNRRMRAVQGYSHRLREHVQVLHHHVLMIADEIPPPVNLDLNAFNTNPLVNAFFVNGKDIDKLFTTDLDVDAYLRAQGKWQIPVLYALLTACRSERQALGMGMQGDVLVREVWQQTVNFSAHKLHAPCGNEMELNAALKTYLFDRVTALVKQEMMSRLPPPSFKLENKSYESKIKSLANPDVYLDQLIEHLKTPSKLLSIDKIHFRLSKLGVELDDGDGQCANEFDIHELDWGNNIRNVVLQIAHVREGWAWG
jgi:hypothetical protein